MNIPSLSRVFAGAAHAFTRFYFTMLFAIVGSVTALVMVACEMDETPLYVHVLYTCSLGLGFSVALSLFAERRQDQALAKWLPAVFLIAAGMYGWQLSPASFSHSYVKNIIWLILMVTSHLWVSVAAFTGKGQLTGFWRFNYILFSRMFLSAFFSAVLFAGLALALTASTVLFKSNIGYKSYFELWIVISGIFNTWFFLAGVPDDFDSLNENLPFPAAIKTFAQYILIPIVLLYVIILYLYGLKIVVEATLPKGWVSVLIISFYIVGILAILLTYPLVNNKKEKWIIFFSKFFFKAALPLVVLLYLAIGVRIRDYGITEPRYFLIVLGLWIGATSSYFIFSTRKNIQVIPISLAIVGIMTQIGPWSVFFVSRQSQLHRLKSALETHKILDPANKTQLNRSYVGQPARENIENIINFFIDRGYEEYLNPIFGVDCKAISANYKKSRTQYQSDWEQKNYLLDSIESKIFYKNNFNDVEARYSSTEEFNKMDKNGIDVAGYARIFELSLSNIQPSLESKIYNSQNDSFGVTAINEDSVIKIKFTGKDSRDSIHIDLTQLANRLVKNDDHNNLPDSLLTVTGTGIAAPKMIISTIRLNTLPNKKEGLGRMDYIKGWILMR